MFKAVVTDVFFDLDHTLWDFEKNSALTFQKIFKSNELDIELARFLEIYVPLNLSFWRLYREEKISKEELRYQRLRTAFDQLGMFVSDDDINQIAEDYIANLSTFNHLFPGTLELLDYLKGSYKLHIITNGFEEIQEKKMRNAGILDYFKVVVNSEMAGVKKPHPKIFKMALEMADAQPKTSLMIGDSLEADILGAKNMGLHTLHFEYQKKLDHTICPSVMELSEIKNYL